MRAAERSLARLLGLPTFRWFEAGTAPTWWWKRLVVRTASALVPYALCTAMFFVVYAVGGVFEFTTRVTVLPEGAARVAGLRDGDKVLAVGGIPVHTWDELRAQVQMHAGPVQIALERSGKRLELSATPRGGRIGVAPLGVKRAAGFGEALSRGTRLPLEVVTSAAKAFISWHENTELKGPVGIVRETNAAARKGWTDVLFFLGILGSYFWPLVAAVHLFDVANRLDLPHDVYRDGTIRAGHASWRDCGFRCISRSGAG